jgi:hypothetical protein
VSARVLRTTMASCKGAKCREGNFALVVSGPLNQAFFSILLDHGGNSLRRAEDLLQDTKEHVSEVLRAGQEAIRPAPTGGA